MSVNRIPMKTAIAAMLDALPQEHLLGHQDAYARRYVLTCRSGRPIELMFEQSPMTPPNLWIESRAERSLATTGITQRASPASSLYLAVGKTGSSHYGRQSALSGLGKADLSYLQPETLAETGEILDQLLAV